MYAHLGLITELHKLILFICFKLLKKFLVSLFDEMAKKNWICDTRITSYTISLLITVEFCSIEELNVLSYFFLQDCYLCLFVKFVTDRHTVRRKWFTSCVDFASWILFMGVSMLITFGWVLVAMITTIC